MDKLPSLFLVFVALLGLTSGAGVIPDDPVYKAVGETVKFNTTLTSAGNPFRSITWRFNNRPITISDSVNTTQPGYEDRITLFTSTGSLELRDLSLSDTGGYSVTILQGLEEHVGSTTLNVLAPVSGVKVTSSSTDVVEGSSVSLSCSVSSGSSLSFLWMNQSSVLTAHSDRVQLTDGNSTLTISPVNRYDQGPFRCQVSNPVSDAFSDPFNLPPISYGPENTKLSVTPLQEHYVVGSDITLFCSADSRPDAQFSWFLNGDLLSDTGSELKLTNIQETQSGDYSCQSFNNKTQRNDTSMQLSVSVLEKISGASVTPSTNQTTEGNSLNLTCDAAGSEITREWMKDGSDLTLSEHMIFSEEKRVLSFQQLQKTDRGEYSCNISNPVSSMEAKHRLVVNYGPDNVKIVGSSEVLNGNTITLNCSAESVPSASFTWSLNGTEIHGAAVYIKEDAEYTDSGEYNCTAKNDVTGKSLSGIFELKVTDLIPTSPPPPPPPPPHGCQAGCIAGIVIACLVVVGAAAGVGYYFYRKKKSQGSSSERRAGGGGQDNSGNKELNYADITAFHRKDGGGVQLRPQNETSEYAQVRGNNNNNNASAASTLPTYNAHMQRVKRQAPQPSDESQPYAQVRKN